MGLQSFGVWKGWDAELRVGDDLGEDAFPQIADVFSPTSSVFQCGFGQGPDVTGPPMGTRGVFAHSSSTRVHEV